MELGQGLGRVEAKLRRLGSVSVDIRQSLDRAQRLGGGQAEFGQRLGRDQVELRQRLGMDRS